MRELWRFTISRRTSKKRSVKEAKVGGIKQKKAGGARFRRAKNLEFKRAGRTENGENGKVYREKRGLQKENGEVSLGKGAATCKGREKFRWDKVKTCKG